MRRLVLIIQLFALLCAIHASAATRVVVALDVSGTMKHYGKWQPDAIAALESIFGGQAVPSAWHLSGRQEDLSQYRVEQENSVILLPFGNVQRTAKFPFFEHATSPLNVVAALQQFPTDPQRYSEGTTNSNLAEVVAAKLANDAEGPSYVIMISDFLKDIEISEQQRAFVNEMENRYARYTVATLSWGSNPVLQMKLLKFVPQQQPNTMGSSEPEGKLHLISPKYIEAANSVGFSWRYEGNSAPLKYDLIVRAADRGNVLFSKNNLISTSVTYPEAESGTVRWIVTAHMENGKEIRQSAMFNVPGKSGTGMGIAVLIICIGGIIALLAYLIKKHGLPEKLQAGLRKKQRSSSSDL